MGADVQTDGAGLYPIDKGRWATSPDTFAYVRSGRSWQLAPHLTWLCDRITYRINKGGYYAIVNMPPRHGKSQLLSRWLPAWFLTWDLGRQVILTSKESRLACDFSRSVRDIVGEQNLRSDSSSVARWMTRQGGGLVAAGVRGSIIGRGGQLLICDDPHKNWEEATSETINDSLRLWWGSTFWTRREPGASVIVVMTRWADCDLTAWLLDSSAVEWDHIVLPAIAEEDDPMGRAPGEALWPDRYPLEGDEGLLATQQTLGSRLFAGLYQQRPEVSGGNIWQEAWWKFWNGIASSPDDWSSERVPSADDPTAEWIQSWDMNFKETSGGSFVVGQVWCRKGSSCYLVDQVRGRWSFVQTVDEVRALSARYPQATLKLIEDRANGPAIMSQLRHELGGMVPVEPCGSKAARAMAVSPLIEAGNVYLPARNVYQWVDGFISEATTFPNARTDDQVDAASQALSRFSGGAGQLLFGAL
jgi:predicted phage terminase large subunit-like protein